MSAKDKVKQKNSICSNAGSGDLATELLFKYHYADKLESFKKNNEVEKGKEYIEKFGVEARKYDDSLLANCSFEILQAYPQTRKKDINLIDLEDSLLEPRFRFEFEDKDLDQELQKLEQKGISLYLKDERLFYHKRKVNTDIDTFTPSTPSINEKIPNDWEFVGSGESYDDCGKWFSVGCLNNHQILDLDGKVIGSSVNGKGFVRATTRSCRRARCPICYESWAHHQAVKAEHRLLCWSIGKKLIDPNGNEKWNFLDVELLYNEDIFKLRSRYINRAFAGAKYGRKPIHVSVSFKPRYFNSEPKKLRKLASNIAQKVGIKGGCLVFHPFRRKNELQNAYSYENVDYSPHFHIVGFGFPNGKKIAKVSRELGINLYNHGVRESVYSTLKYELSHCGIKKNTHSVIWFGCLAYNNFTRLPQIPKYDALCPICQSKLRPVKWVGADDNPLDHLLGDFLVETEYWDYDVSLNSWSGR